jgi:hypothetical protein
MQALGIILERIVQVAWSRVFERRQDLKDKQPRSEVLENSPTVMWKRMVGLIWVVIYMVWTVPGWMYIHVSGHHTRILPFSVLDRLVRDRLLSGTSS